MDIIYRSIQKLEGEVAPPWPPPGMVPLGLGLGGASVSANPTTKQHSKTGFSCWRLLGCSGSPQSSPTQQPGSTFFEGSCTWAFPK